MLPDRSSSLWSTRTSGAQPRPRLDRPLEVDVVVVGAGITGLTTAVLLARAGQRVAVLEDRRVGAGATGKTTAKLTVLHGNVYDELRDKHGAEGAATYAAANDWAMHWIIDYCEQRAPEAAIERRAAVTYAQSPTERATIEDEVEAARAAGVTAELVDDLDVPFPFHGAIRVPDQAQFDPMPFLAALADELVELGGSIFEDTRARGVSDGRRGATVHTEGGDIRCHWVVAATGLPFLDRGGFFARVEPKGSYILAVRTAGPVPEDMYITAGSPTRSLRTAPDGDGGRFLLVGGESHKTGQGGSNLGHYRALSDFAEQHFTVTEAPHRWFTEDFISPDKVPFAGPLWPLPTRVLVATGYSKWGMTNGVAAARVLTARITGADAPSWSQLFDSTRLPLKGAGTIVHANANVAKTMVQGWVGTARHGQVDALEEGQGVVIRRGLERVAVSQVDGQRHEVSAVCPHLGGILCWNDAELTWDCPLHGSRFQADGRLEHGPSNRDLPSKS